MQSTARVIGVHVGRPRTVTPARGRAWTSAIWKTPTTGPVQVDSRGLDGDEQADLRVHGGPNKAICVYPARHYPYWHDTLDVAIGPGGFGENLTIDGLDETGVCIGDRFRIGTVITEVSQPRSPCYKVARRWGIKDLAVRFQTTGRTGWYLRVIAHGHLETGAEMTLLARPNPRLTVAHTNQVRWLPAGGDPDDAATLAACEQLSEGWQRHFRDAQQP